MTKKEGKIYVFLCICLICVLVTGMYFTPEKSSSGYTLAESSGALIVLSPDGKVLESITDTNLADLPQSDRKRLQQGITVFTEEELMSLIEDFLC